MPASPDTLKYVPDTYKSGLERPPTQITHLLALHKLTPEQRELMSSFGITINSGGVRYNTLKSFSITDLLEIAKTLFKDSDIKTVEVLPHRFWGFNFGHCTIRAVTPLSNKPNQETI